MKLNKTKRSGHRSGIALLPFLFFGSLLFAQDKPDSSAAKKWTTHFQITVISQIHSAFKSPYSGLNSLADSVEQVATSITSTLFLGRKLWKGAAFYFNPEISGGRGLSYTKGVAGALNGETYRVGEAAPQPFIARAYFQQQIALGKTSVISVADDFNQVAGTVPESRITISAGRFSISDFFDDNSFSKDPRIQFLNWSLWANGAWDYPANTRGYTYGLVGELIKPGWSVKASSVAVPVVANFHLMEYHFSGAHSETFEFDRSFSIWKRPGTARVIFSETYSRAPSYAQGLQALATSDSFLLNVFAGNEKSTRFGGKKFGLGLNLEQQLAANLGFFCRLGWNDGKYASWAFTEIDRTAAAGLSLQGGTWNRPYDVVGVAGVVNGISSGHREFLERGGYGFIIGDGRLNYGDEMIVESYYSAKLFPFLWASFDYQFVDHPGYNKDRGPVHVFGVRAHIEF